MNVFIARVLEKLRRPGFFAQTLERRDNFTGFGGGQNPHTLQRPGKRLRATNVDVHQPPIEMEGTRKPLENLGWPFLESAAPQLHTDFLAVLPAAFSTAARTWIGSPIRLMNPRASR